jgi:hypothetical protein
MTDAKRNTDNHSEKIVGLTLFGVLACARVAATFLLSVEYLR